MQQTRYEKIFSEFHRKKGQKREEEETFGIEDFSDRRWALI